jgi:hypothetical protein
MALMVGLDAHIERAPLCDELISIQRSVKNYKRSSTTKYFKFDEEIQHGRRAP